MLEQSIGHHLDPELIILITTKWIDIHYLTEIHG